MDSMMNVLGSVGAWAGSNKYLSALKNAFQDFMPATMAGAVGLLWLYVLVDETSGLASLIPAVSALSVFNPIFSAVNFATISCITVGITFMVAQEICEANGMKGAFCGVFGVVCWLTVTQTTVVTDGVTFTGIPAKALGAEGLFTGMIVGILSAELLSKLSSIDGLKIHMPDNVPPGVARAFDVMIPAILSALIVASIGFAAQTFTGVYLNDLIAKYIQMPLQGVGASIWGLYVFTLLTQLFWSIGIHGNNMVGAVKTPLLTPLGNMNAQLVMDGKKPEYIINPTFFAMINDMSGCGITLGLIIAFLIFGKREDNRTVAKLSLAPGLFNINETMTFGLPIVMNPIIIVPFILAPLLSSTIGYILTVIGFCPILYVGVPWTTPPLIGAFLAGGGSITAAITQGICLLAVTLLYIPFALAYEKYQNQQDAKAEVE